MSSSEDGAAEASQTRRFPASLFRRSATNRVLVGVAGGMSERTGIDATIIRAAFLVLLFGGGAGAVLYVAAWAFSAPPSSDAQLRLRVTSSELRQVISLACIVAGLLIFLRSAGLWPGDSVVWPVALATFGAMVIWTRADRSEHRAPTSPLEAIFAAKVSLPRILVGAAFIVVGMATTLSTNVPLFSGPRGETIVFPVLVTIVGLSLIFGPWLYRLAQQLSEEGRERIRSEERSEMAAHLHDSVLQTLALIQRTEDPREMTSLARVQERELRAWLFGRLGDRRGDMLSAAIDAMAARVEALHHVAVEAVVVGDHQLDERMDALLYACTEGALNAAKHSGAQSVSVYVEVEDEVVTAFVRDSGNGFDPLHVPADRGGIAESITARMHRWGGAADIVSSSGRGTEVRLSMPRRRP